jgi:hypothetical protein
MYKNNKVSSLAFATVISLFTTQAFASLVELDYVYGSGDKQLTFDSSSGLEWLDLTATRGRSINQVEAGFGGYLADGFRYATGSEVLHLFETAGAPQGYYTDTTHILSVQSLMLMLGITYQNNPPSRGNPFGQQTTYGITGDTFSYADTPTWHSYAQIGATDTVAGLGVGGQIFKNSEDWLIGSFLVRTATVPEPNSALLAGLGVLFIALTRRSVK